MPGPDRSTVPSLPIRATVALLASLLANVALVGGAVAVGLAPGFRPIAVPPVAFLTAVGVLGGVVAYWLCDRFLADGETWFVRIAAGVLVLSFVPDVSLLLNDPAATLPAVVLLLVMHVIAAAAVVGTLVYWGRGGTDGTGVESE